MTYDETVASVRAHATRTSCWAAEEAERVSALYRKYSTGAPSVDPRDIASIAESHRELLLRVSGGEAFRCEMLIEAMATMRKGGPD